MATADNAGTEIYYEVTGDGPPVVLLHGFPDSGRLWRHQLPALTGAGYRVIVPDMRGYGRSTRPVEVDAYDILTFGDITWTTAESLRHAVGDSLFPGVCLIIDLGHVERIDAVGVSALVGSVRHARSVGGVAQIVNVRPRVRLVLEFAGAERLLLGSTVTTDGVA